MAWWNTSWCLKNFVYVIIYRSTYEPECSHPGSYFISPQLGHKLQRQTDRAFPSQYIFLPANIPSVHRHRGFYRQRARIPTGPCPSVSKMKCCRPFGSVMPNRSSEIQTAINQARFRSVNTDVIWFRYTFNRNPCKLMNLTQDNVIFHKFLH